MTRYKHTARAVGLTGLASAILLGLSAVPVGATLVCPPGVTNPKYCTNVLPLAVTGDANPRGAGAAILNGTSGPNVAGGDITYYFFQYGKSKHYGYESRPIGTIGACPDGASRCSSVPKTRGVSSYVGGLDPCTVYHFRIVSLNPDGETKGNDATFGTRYGAPLESAQSPGTVKRNTSVSVTIKLRYSANVDVAFVDGGGNVVTNDHVGQHSPGTFTTHIQAPGNKGRYHLRVTAKANCGTQTIEHPVTVTS